MKLTKKHLIKLIKEANNPPIRKEYLYLKNYFLGKKYMNSRQDHDNYGIYQWFVTKGQRINPWSKISKQKIDAKYSGLTEDQKLDYAILATYPFHNSFTQFDLRIIFLELSDKQLKSTKRK